VKVLKEPEIESPLGKESIREEYFRAYNIYTGSSFGEDKSGDFLGVAFYNKQFKKLVADKVFKR